MARGRDAADVALTTNFGRAILKKFFIISDEDAGETLSNCCAYGNGGERDSFQAVGPQGLQPGETGGRYPTDLTARCRFYCVPPAKEIRPFGNQTSSSGWSFGVGPQGVGDDDEEKIKDATTRLVAKPTEVSRRCAVMPSGTPMSAKAMQEMERKSVC